VGTVSGTDITYGTGVAVEAGTSTDTAKGVFCGGSINKTIISYYSGAVKAKVCSVSGTTPSFGTAAIGSGNTTRFFPLFDPDTNRIFVMSDKDNLGAGSMQQLFIDGTSVGFGALLDLSGGDVIGGSIKNQITSTAGVYDTNSNKMLFFAGGTNTAGGSISGQAVVINSAKPDFIGVAAAAISNGATGTITVVSGINEGQSSLQVGSPYGYSPSTGGLVLGGGNVFATATAADKLFITKGTA